MPIRGGDPVPVIDLHHFAVAAAPAGDRNGAAGGGADRIADVAAEIDAGVHRRFMDKGIGANAEWRTFVDVPRHRLAHRPPLQLPPPCPGVRPGYLDTEGP